MPAAAADELLTFTDRRAAEIAGVSLGKLLYWEFTNVVGPPSARRRFSLRSSVKLYDFEETVALLVVAELRRRGLSLQLVRKITDHLRRRGYDHPFNDLVFATSGRDVYFQHPDETWEGGAEPDQLVLHEVLNLDLIRAMVRAAVARKPGDYGRVERRRKTMGYKPVFAGTRVPVETVERWLQRGRSEDQILDAYPDLVPADIEYVRKHPSVSS